ncbi:VOC family protein [Novosphingobium malaysiense]|uniref:Glyoxalase n=1 Tax=Novosphingobium malaysiense TaxID=1348853 RepID=A0A0B1ZJZ7_9SPHN|nr:VOC family protein [Novosphingobium malaysiense]KHK91450.1 glyoxalase [Novosphingobium malaysiense]
MADPAGSFIWYELMTTDPDAASAFYGDVMGWQVTGGGPQAKGIEYRHIIRSDGGSAGGMLTLTDEMLAGGARPGWFGYIHTRDIDATVEAILAEGGGVMMPKTTIEVGSFALVTDPQGVPFYVMTPVPPAHDPDATSDVFSVDRPQTVRWNELVTPDDEAAVAFYGRHFGWTQEGAMPMGDLGDYRFLQANGVGIGAVMKKADFMPAAGWGFYFGVEDIDTAIAAAKAGGGNVLGEPDQIPGGEWTVHAFDPQGAFFGLVGPRRIAGQNS